MRSVYVVRVLDRSFRFFIEPKMRFWGSWGLYVLFTLKHMPASSVRRRWKICNRQQTLSLNLFLCA